VRLKVTRFLWNPPIPLLHPDNTLEGADLRGISNTNLPFLVNLSFLVHKQQNYKLAFRKLTKRQVEAIQTCPSCYRHPNQASIIWHMSHHVTFTARHMKVCITSHSSTYCMSHQSLILEASQKQPVRSRSTWTAHMSEACTTYEWVMSHIWLRHVSCMNEACHAPLPESNLRRRSEEL